MEISKKSQQVSHIMIKKGLKKKIYIYIFRKRQ